MDTAPVGLVSDAISLASFADSTVYIVRNGYTLRRLLGFIEELYKYKKVPSLSILLNDVKTTGVYGRYYGSYGYNAAYGYGNSSGYFDEGLSSGGLFRRVRNFWKRWFS
jgi:tyrosine-protein kinase Etk/Wzc